MFRNFDLDKVTLSDTDFARRRALVMEYVACFDVDRLMHTFLVNAGIPSTAEPLGGWESPKCGLRGHFVGHFLSACSKFAFADKDEALKAKAFAIIDMMQACAKPNGYLSAFEEEKLDILEYEEDRGVWAPYYTLHKIMQGLVDCHTYLGSEKALTLAVNLAHYIYGRFAKLSFWKIDGILHCTKVNPVNEFGGIGDVLYSLYEITKDQKILRLAEIFDRDYFIGNLASGKDVLEDLHSNTHLPMVIAAMHRYNIGGDPKYKTAATNFYRYLLGRTFANGNSSSKATAFIKEKTSEKSEHWGCCGDLSSALTGGESESCCAHNTERILQQLFQWYGSAEYLEHMEVLKYNAVLNSSSNATGLSQYHQPMGAGASKKFNGLYDTFWCCTASGVEAMSEIQKNIWFQDGDSILVNMFISSTVLWDETDVSIVQTSGYPDRLISRLCVRVRKPTGFKLVFRETAVKTVRFNSQPTALTRENGFVSIWRIFRDNDEIEIEINASLSLVALKGSGDTAAVLYGNIVLARLGNEPAISNVTNENINEVLRRVDEPELKFTVGNGGNAVAQFVPLYRVEAEIYTVYSGLCGGSSSASEFSFAKDGSGAYEG